MLKERIGADRAICGREAQWTPPLSEPREEAEAHPLEPVEPERPQRKSLWRLSWEIFYRHHRS